jgi:serine/threonine-protein kinase
MTPERYQQINALAEAALTMSRTRRNDFLDRVCGSDPDLRMRVSEVVAGYECSAGFLEAPALEAWAQDAATSKPTLVGRQVGRYLVLSHLGSGGIGEVWLAKDQELTRQVALKLLAPELAADSEQAQRFRQEARAASSLSHANLVTVFDIGSFEGRQFIAQEYVQGRTVRDLLRDGPVGLEEAIDIASQVAAALGAAHAAQIVHRDIKPENVMVRPDGLVKVLDFGVARFMEAAAAHSPGPALASLTRTGIIIGTPRYMSPEQARGLPVDARSDIFSLGVVFYELLSGAVPFDGRTPSDVLAAILVQDPPALTGYSQPVPDGVERIVRRCLNKEPAARYPSAEALRDDLKKLTVAGSQSFDRQPPHHQGRGIRWRALAVGAALLVLVAVVLWLTLAPRQAGPSGAAVIRSTLALPAGHVPEVAVISPEGDQVVYQALRNGVRQLYRRYLDEEESRPVPKSDGATQPFFSPDGTELGFYAPASIRIAGASGTRDLVAIPAEFDLRRAVWGADQFIYYTTPADGIWRIPTRGGQPQAVLRPGPAERAQTFYFPQELLSGSTPGLLFSTNSGPKRRSIGWAALPAGSPPRIVVERGMGGEVLPGGHLLYYWQGKLLAAPFDAHNRKLAGSAVEVLAKSPSNGWRGPNASVSRNGTLVYLEEDLPRRKLLWVNRLGRETPLPVPDAAYEQAEVSPDGTKLAIARKDELSKWSMWIYELRSGAWTRVFDVDVPRPRSVWSPDGKSIVAASLEGDAQFVNLYRFSLVAPGAPERLTEEPDFGQFPASWSAAANAILFTEGVHIGTQSDIFALPLDGGRKPRPMVVTPGVDRGPCFSPDGRRFAFASDQNKASEIFVQPFDLSSPPRQVSSGGGTNPAWSPSGTQLYYLTPTQALMEVNIHADGLAEPPHQLLPPGFTVRTDWWTRGYSIAPDGRFLVIRDIAGASPPAPRIRVIVNWTEELKRLVPRP